MLFLRVLYFGMVCETVLVNCCQDPHFSLVWPWVGSGARGLCVAYGTMCWTVYVGSSI